jgi:hypothetical protein
MGVRTELYRKGSVLGSPGWWEWFSHKVAGQLAQAGIEKLRPLTVSTYSFAH